MWFIQFIIIEYILFYIINRVFYSKKIKYLIWIISGILIFLFGNGIQSEQGFIFFSGIIYSDKKNKIDRVANYKKLYLSIALISIAVCALAIKQTSIIRTSSEYIYYFVELIIKNGAALGIIMTINTVNKFKKIRHTKQIEYIGIISYEIYLVHAILFYILRNNQTIESLTIFTGITIVGSIFLNKFMIILKKFNK